MPEIVLKTDKLSKHFRNRWAVQDVDLEVHRGDVFGFLGPNGAGKSTTIRMIFSLIKPTGGRITLFGHDLHAQRQKALQRVAGIVEKPDFYLYLSAFRNMEIAGALTLGKNPDHASILSVLETVGLADRALDRVKTFSHGMKQRLGIAQALLCRPDMILLDEPTNGLDPQGMKEVRELITTLSRERGITVFLSSHLLNEVEQVATRMAIINQGKIVVQGSVKELLQSRGNVVVIDVAPRDQAVGIIRQLDIVSDAVVLDHGISVRVDKENIPVVVQAMVENNFKVFSVTHQNSLEQYFLQLTESDHQLSNNK